MLEAQDIANSGWDYTNSNSYITLSMWVRSSVAQTFYWIAHSLDGTAKRYPFAVTLAANTWTKVEQSFPGNASLTFDDNNEEGLRLDCGLYWGTTFTTSSVPLDQWGTHTYSERTRDFDATWANTTNATFDMTGVQLEVGSKATPFEHESYGQTLAKCQRYYQETIFTNGQAGNSAGTNVYGNLHTIVSMRAMPTVALNGPLEVNSSGVNTTQSTMNIASYGTSSVNRFIIISNFSGLTSGKGACLRFNANQNLITLSAEL